MNEWVKLYTGWYKQIGDFCLSATWDLKGTNPSWRSCVEIDDRKVAVSNNSDVDYEELEELVRLWEEEYE